MGQTCTRRRNHAIVSRIAACPSCCWHSGRRRLRTGADRANGSGHDRSRRRPLGKPSIPAGFYQMTFLNRAREEIPSLPVGSGSALLVRVHVEDSAHQPAQDGSVLYEVCRYRGVSPTTGTRGGAAPSARCADRSARWERWVSAEFLLSGDTYAGVDVVRVPCVMGWRATYSGSRTIAPVMMGPADITWQ